MVNIAGVNLPNKKVPFALCYIKGIGSYRGFLACKELGINPDLRIWSLSHDEIASIRLFIDKNFQVEGDLTQKVNQDVRSKVGLRSYQGIRHQLNLPVRGQRTRDNANTRRKGIK